MHERGQVKARNGLRLRESPRDGQTLDVLPQGTEVEILGRETWLRVRVGRQVGFVLADHVDPGPPATAGDGAAAAAAAIQRYSGAPFSGEAIRANVDFVPALDRMAGYAAAHGIDIYVTSSLREPYAAIAGAIVEPARCSNHFVGHAIDLNLIHAGDWLHSNRLRDFASLPTGAQAFLTDIRNDAELRWGGDFQVEDPVHIEDGLNLRDPVGFRRKLERLWAS